MIERTYNIPLRKEFMKVPKYKRAKKSIRAIKEFLSKHLKQEDLKKIKLGQKLNLKIWEHGIKNPPHHVKVNAIKTDEGIIYAELFGYEIKLPETKETKKEKKAKEKAEKEEKEKISEEEKKKEEEKTENIEKIVESEQEEKSENNLEVEESKEKNKKEKKTKTKKEPK